MEFEAKQTENIEVVNDSLEEKKVRVISPGWVYSNKELQISRPKVKEVEQYVDK